ncbi:hypothetical protein PT974_01092 [Cladobotryum mycophilum]|uniref:Serine/threonine-protein phosphatase 4 regulatory subunit 3-like central domain-containing protein n=1 Tax=Cladobotryum mycophilum TaxID=491253 RepID=A0ABR0T2P5_9HYPO
MPTTPPTPCPRFANAVFRDFTVSIGASCNGTVAALTILSQAETSELSLQQHLELAPDLVAYNNQLATGADPEPLMMAQPVSHQATEKKRVKVYELRNNDWYDRGTGFCSAIFHVTEDGRKDPKVIVESEDHPERMLLETKIQKEDGFQKQQETLIVWQEPGSGVDMALSFQEAEGCALIWRFVNNIQQSFQTGMAAADDGLSDDLAIEVPTNISLPPAELGNLQEIDTNMRIMSSTANGREALAKFIMTEDYIGKLTNLFEVAEDLESLPDLHRLCNIMKSIILLNDTSIIEHAVSDDYLMGVVGALEYDPDFPYHKANHRIFLSDPNHFKEVVPFEEEQIRRKIHQTHRLQYLKDVVLARILDDPTFSVLNSLIFFNQVDIVQYVQSNPPFLGKLFAIFSPAFHIPSRRKNAVIFIQQCCVVAKNIQPPARQSLYNNFLAHGLLQVIHFGLRHDDIAVRVGANDILVSIIDHDPIMIRQTVYRQMHEGQSSLMDSLIALFLVETDLGVKTQISEALRVILDQGQPGPGPEGFPKVNGEFAGRPRPQPSSDPQQELFLTRFYETCMLRLYKPLIDLEHRAEMIFTVQEISVVSSLVDILGFFVRQHHRFSRYFIMTHNIAQRVAQLLACPEKHIQLTAIRYYRSLIGFQEEFYIKNLIEKDVLSPVLDLLVAEMPRDNMVTSACLELLEYIRKENLKELVKHLVANHRDRLVPLSYMPTIRELILRYDQTQGYTTNMEYFMEAEEDMTRKPPPNTRMMEHINVDPREEEYWDGSDPEDENEALANDSSAGNESSTYSKPLVDYLSDSDDEEGQDADGDSKSKDDDDANTTAGSPGFVPLLPPERLSEKRRREEEDDDELGKLMQSKRRNSTSTESNSSVSSSLSQRRKSFTAGSGNGTPKKIAISLSPALRTASPRSDEES